MVPREVIEQCFLGHLKNDQPDDAWEIRNPRAEFFTHTKTQEVLCVIELGKEKPFYKILHYDLVEILEKFAFLNGGVIKWYKRNKVS